jgi:hypothetical protein
MTYDTDVYVNFHSPCFDWELISCIDEEKGSVQSYYHIYTNSIILNNTFSGTLRFSNIDEYFEGEEEYKYYPESVKIIMVQSAWIKVKEHRNQWMFDNLIRIKWLNPNIPFPLLHGLAKDMNIRVMENPMGDEEVERIARNVFLNQYVATPNVRRKILFNPSLDTPTKDKRSICAKLIGAERTQRTLQRIHDAIEGYAGEEKITAKLVSRISGLELNNVKRKWKVFKDWVRDLNAQRRG